MTVRLTGLFAMPEPLDVANTTVSEYEPGDRPSTLELREMLMFVVPPTASVPLVAERLSQLTVLVADQTIATPPALLNV